LTQPLSEDGTLSEKEKIEIYSEILSNYDLKDVVIKVHPREKLNYRNIFPKVEILDEYFPVELFKIFNIEPEKVITIFSSAVFGIAKRENIDFYGTEINEKILKKFLRKQSTEYAKIRDIVLREALANNDVAISLELDGKSSVKTSGKGIENAILELFGKSVLRNLTKFKYGYLGNVEILRSSKDYIFTYVNKRYVKSATIERAILDGYYTKLMKGKYPFAIIFFDIMILRL